jgi:8-oxo-dGTP pyrophosphatase MutT (NUDIX family)
MSIDIEETNIGAHAILLSRDNKIILQQRDNNPQIVNPGLISIFGGTLKASDNIEEGLKRELLEELELNTSDLSISKLGIYYKTKEIDGTDFEIHIFVIKNIDINKLKLHEGKGFFHDTIENALKNEKLTRITRLALEDLNQSISNYN